MPTEAELAAEVAALKKQLADYRLANVPEAQRAAVQTQMQLEQEREALREERARLNQVVRMTEAAKISMATGIPEDELVKHETLSEMRQFALDTVSQQKSEEIAALITGKPKPGSEEAKAAEEAAAAEAAAAATPGATAPPTTSSTTSGGTAALGSDPTKELLEDKNIGRGTGRMEDFVAQLRATTPFDDVSLRTGEVSTAAPPAPPPPPPAVSSPATTE